MEEDGKIWFDELGQPIERRRQILWYRRRDMRSGFYQDNLFAEVGEFDTPEKMIERWNMESAGVREYAFKDELFPSERKLHDQDKADHLANNENYGRF